MNTARLMTAATVAISVSICFTANASIVAHYTLDEQPVSAGSTYAESVGTNASITPLVVGVASGSAGSSVTGVLGNAFYSNRPNGTNGATAQRDTSGGTIVLSGLPTGSSSRTLLVWANLDSYTIRNAADTGDINGFIFGGYGKSSANNRFGIGSGYSAATQNKLICYGWGGGDIATGGVALAPTGQWGLYAATYDGAAIKLSAVFDVAGNPTLATETTATLAVNTSLANAASVAVSGNGNINAEANQRRMPGKVDDMSIWNEVLTDAQVRSIYSGAMTL